MATPAGSTSPHRSGKTGDGSLFSGSRKKGEPSPFLHLILLLFLLACVPAAEAESVLVGAAKVELALPPHPPLAGYSRRQGKPSTGIHDPVFVRAVVIKRPPLSIAIVSCDLLIVDEHLTAAVQRELTARQLTFAPLLLAATHTHSGPGAYGRKFLEKLSMGHFDPAVFRGIVSTIVQALEQASRDMQPAMMDIGHVVTRGLVQNRMREDGVIDQELSVVAFTRNQDPVAVLVNFAAHPTTLGASNRQLSADYPGVVSRAVEAQWPQAVCLFLAGAVADQAPVKRGEGFEKSEWLGQQLAEPTVEFLRASRSTAIEGLVGAQQAMPLSPARMRIGPIRLPSWIGGAFVDDDATLTVLWIGRAVVIGTPCDLSAELGFELKQFARARGDEPLVVSFANDYIGYCLSAQAYRSKSYEATMAFNGPDTGDRIIAQLKQMLEALSSHP